MIETYFVVYGDPVPKGRPRFRSTGSFVQTYTPAATKEAEARILKEYTEQSGINFGSAALILRMVFWMPVPKSVSKFKHDAMVNCKIPHATRPDADNCAKLVMDALNKKAWHDDAQIVDDRVEKKYSDEPRTEVWIKEWVY